MQRLRRRDSVGDKSRIKCGDGTGRHGQQRNPEAVTNRKDELIFKQGKPVEEGNADCTHGIAQEEGEQGRHQAVDATFHQ